MSDTATPAPEVSLLLTVYNEEESLRPLQEGITSAMGELGLTYEVVYVDDGSTDDSLCVLNSLAVRDDRIRILKFRRNRGKSAGLRAGFAATRAPVIVTLDADLQDEPAEIGRLLSKMDEGYDLVVGWKSPRRDPFSKTFPSKVVNFINANASGLPIHDVDSGLKAYRREVIEHLEIRGALYRFLPVMAHHAGFRVAEIPVRHNPRRYSQSKYGGSRFITGFLDILSVLAITRLRDKPAHLGLLLGPIVAAPPAVLTGLAVYTLSDHKSAGQRAAASILSGGAVLSGTALAFAGLGIMCDLLVSHARRERDCETNRAWLDG